MRGARALVRVLAFSISARSTGSGGGRFASFLHRAQREIAIGESLILCYFAFVRGPFCYFGHEWIIPNHIKTPSV